MIKAMHEGDGAGWRRFSLRARSPLGRRAPRAAPRRQWPYVTGVCATPAACLHARGQKNDAAQSEKMGRHRAVGPIARPAASSHRGLLLQMAANGAGGQRQRQRTAKRDRRASPQTGPWRAGHAWLHGAPGVVLPRESGAGAVLLESRARDDEQVYRETAAESRQRLVAVRLARRLVGAGQDGGGGEVGAAPDGVVRADVLLTASRF